MTPEDLRTELSIDQNQLDHELIANPGLCADVGLAFVRAVSERDAKKDNLKAQLAKLAIHLREEMLTNGEKVTEKAVEAAVGAHPDNAKLHEELRLATLKAAELEVMRGAFSTRSSMLRDLVSLYGTDYQMNTSAGDSRPTGRTAGVRKTGTRKTRKKRISSTD